MGKYEICEIIQRGGASVNLYLTLFPRKLTSHVVFILHQHRVCSECHLKACSVHIPAAYLLQLAKSVFFLIMCDMRAGLTLPSGSPHPR